MLLVLFLLLTGVVLTIRIKVSLSWENNKFSTNFYVYILGFICIYRGDIKKIRWKISKRKKLKKKIGTKVIFKILKASKLNVEALKIKLDVYTGDAASTAILTGSIRAVIVLMVRILNVKQEPGKYLVCVNPVYNNVYSSQIVFKCIISQNIVHIITAIVRLIIEWRRENYGRKASNRRAYGHSYE